MYMYYHVNKEKGNVKRLIIYVQHYIMNIEHFCSKSGHIIDRIIKRRRFFFIFSKLFALINNSLKKTDPNKQ